MTKFIKQAEVHSRLLKLACAARYIRRKRKQSKRASYKQAISNGAATAIGAGIGGLIGGGLGYGFGAKDDKLFSTLMGAGAGAGIGGLAGHYGGFGNSVSKEKKEEEDKEKAITASSSRFQQQPRKSLNTLSSNPIVRKGIHDQKIEDSYTAMSKAVGDYNATLNELNSRKDLTPSTKKVLEAETEDKLNWELYRAQNTLDASTMYNAGHPYMSAFINGNNLITSNFGDGPVQNTVGGLVGMGNEVVTWATGYGEALPKEETTTYKNSQGVRRKSEVPAGTYNNFVRAATPEGQRITPKGKDRLTEILDAQNAPLTQEAVNNAVAQLHREAGLSEETQGAPVYFTDKYDYGTAPETPEKQLPILRLAYASDVVSSLPKGTGLTQSGIEQFNHIIKGLQFDGYKIDSSTVKNVLDYLQNIQENTDELYIMRMTPSQLHKFNATVGRSKYFESH